MKAPPIEETTRLSQQIERDREREGERERKMKKREDGVGDEAKMNVGLLRRT